jgi:tRNA 2-thiouridine synthesizing protein A
MKYHLDLKNILCPLPVIRTQNKIKQLSPGDLLELSCTDPGTLQDIPTWCRMYGHQLVETIQDGTYITFIIEVGE